jgi:nucleoside-diphosphate-sugar epimerase
MSLRAFVTGASGFVGTNLVRELANQGWAVTALVREDSPLEDLEGLDIELCQGDITDPGSLTSAIPAGVDCVFHVAASTSIWSHLDEQQRRINVDGTRNVLEAAIAAGAKRLVHTSSFIVWGFFPGLLTEESEPVEADGWINYIDTKREAEQLVKKAVAEGRIDATICNPAHILGPGDRRNWSRMIVLVNRGKLPGVPPGGGAFADVREVAKAHIAAFHRGQSGQNYILGGEDAMFLDVIHLTGEILGRKVPGKASPAWLLKAAARVYVMVAAITGKAPDLTPEGAAMITTHIRCDSSRAQRELGYRFTPIRELLEDTCAWLHEKGMLG